MALTPEEIQRYKRHLVLREVGGQGQQKLKAARVLVVGAGGLGSPLLMYLAAAGVGTLGVIDDDVVSLDNLQRQIVHDTAHVGAPKVASAANTIARLNPHVAVEAHEARLDASNALDLIPRYDMVADGSDNFATRYLVSDACYLARRPLAFAAVGPFDGYVTTFKPYETSASGDPLPTYRCIFPEAPPPGTVANCAEVGVLGAIVGVVGTLQATEVLKEILGIGDSLAGRLLIYDGRGGRFETVNVAWDPENPLSGRRATIKDLSMHARAEGTVCAPSTGDAAPAAHAEVAQS
jgi:adenylyltransferase/sulfurtransferase